jgi:predicted neuraminidase
MMVRGRPILLHDGDYLLPVYQETGHDRENVGADTTSLFIRIDPDTHTWKETGRITSRTGNLQPAPVEIERDHLIAYCRRGGGYEPVKDGYVIRSESHDGGLTWSSGVDSKFPNPNAAVDFIKLANGHLLLVYNNSMLDRTPLTVAISTDDDKSWPHRKNIAEGKDDFAYPVALQAKDGKIHIIYTKDERATIMHAVFDESAILDSRKGRGR